MGKFADRVKETTTTTGTGDLTLLGAATGFRTFNAAFGTNVRFYYAISTSGGSEWETGEGYLTTSTNLVRADVSQSSNSNALVNFSAGTKDVYMSLIASEVADKSMIFARALNLHMGY